jgi:hypothetical protein
VTVVSYIGVAVNQCNIAVLCLDITVVLRHEITKICRSERSSPVAGIPDSYFGGPGFKSRLGNLYSQVSGWLPSAV